MGIDQIESLSKKTNQIKTNKKLEDQFDTSRQKQLPKE